MNFFKYKGFVIPELTEISNNSSIKEQLLFIKKHRRQLRGCSGIGANCFNIICDKCILDYDNYNKVTKIFKADDVNIKKEFKL